MKARSVALIITSTTGNFFFFTFTILEKIMSNNYWQVWNDLGTPGAAAKGTRLHTMVLTTCQLTMMVTWLAKPWWLAPYLFRSLRLRQIKNMTEEALSKENVRKIDEKQTHTRNFLIRESNIVKLLGIFLIPFIILTIFMSVFPQFAAIMPFMCSSQCIEQTNKFTDVFYFEYINNTMFTI